MNNNIVTHNTDRFVSLRWGILGYGKHCAQAALPALVEAQGLEVRALGTSNPAKVPEDLANTFDCIQSYEEVCRNSEVDAIYIALPNHLHHRWTLESLKAGKHVLCEKPLALNAAEASEMTRAAQQANCVLAEAFMYRFHPQHQEVLSLLREGELGSPRLFEAHLHYHLQDLSNIRLRREVGGGGILDVGCYLVDSALFLFSNEAPQRISATMQVGSESKVDEAAFIQFVYADGSAAHLSCGCLLERENRYAIYGSNGSLHASPAFVVARKKQVDVVVRQIAGKTRTIRIPASNQLRSQFEAFTAWVQGDDSAAALFNEPLRNATILDAIRLSAEEGREVYLEENSGSYTL